MTKRPWPRNLIDAVSRYGTGSNTRPVVKWLEECLHKQQETQQKERLLERGTLAKQNPYVTDAGKECERQVYKSFRNEEAEPFDTTSLIKFAFGHAAEEALASIASHGDARIVREVRVEFPIENTIVSGRIDFLVLDEKSHRIIELKSIGSKAMMAMLWKGEAGKEPNRHQLNLYLHASHLGLLKVDDEVLPPFDAGELVYMVTDATKGSPNIHAFPVAYDATMADADLLKLAGLWNAAQNGHDPGIPPEYLDAWTADNKPPLWPCAYCQFNKSCWDPIRIAKRSAA